MRKMDQYLTTIDTIYPDGHARETIFRDSGEMLAPPAIAAPKDVLRGLLARFRAWRMKRNGRLALRELSDDQLEDIGITRAQARKEAEKSTFLLR